VASRVVGEPGRDEVDGWTDTFPMSSMIPEISFPEVDPLILPLSLPTEAQETLRRGREARGEAVGDWRPATLSTIAAKESAATEFRCGVLDGAFEDVLRCARTSAGQRCRLRRNTTRVFYRSKS